VKKVIRKTVGLMIKEFSSEPENLQIFIGPHICKKHYEVKEDVSSKFKKYGVKKHLDLAAVAALQLTELGVRKENIKIDKRCTFEDKDLFSYRCGDLEKSNLFTITI